MIRFRQKQEEAGLKQKQAEAALKDNGYDITASDLSKIENGHLLPTPSGAEVMCEVYGTTMSGLADIEDVTFRPVRPRKAAKRRRGKSIRKFAVDLESELASGLKVWLPSLGYRSNREWVIECATEARERYNKLQGVDSFFERLKKRKSPPVVTTLTATAQGNKMTP